MSISILFLLSFLLHGLCEWLPFLLCSGFLLLQVFSVFNITISHHNPLTISQSDIVILFSEKTIVEIADAKNELHYQLIIKVLKPFDHNMREGYRPQHIEMAIFGNDEISIGNYGTIHVFICKESACVLAPTQQPFPQSGYHCPTAFQSLFGDEN